MTSTNDFKMVIKNPNAYLIIDDAHKMYDIGSFWASLKQKSCRVICFATAEQKILGSACTTRKELDNSLRYETVMFSQDDHDALVAKFRESDSGKKLLTKDVIAHIDLLTNRHPGLLYASLKEVLGYVNPKSNNNLQVCFPYNTSVIHNYTI